jgi:hypothetical protein
MQTAHVVSADVVQHPKSNHRRLCITTDAPWASAGVTYPGTEVWAEPDAVKPDNGETISWDHSHVWIRGVRYDKPELDNSAAPTPLWG